MWTKETRRRYERKGFATTATSPMRSSPSSTPTLGLVINFAVSPADVQDRDMFAPVLAVARRRLPSVAKAVVDGGYQGPATANEVAEVAGIPLEIVRRPEAAKGFVLLAKRRIVERTLGWPGSCRRLARDYENLTRSHAAFFVLAMIRVMLRRIARLSKTR